MAITEAFAGSQTAVVGTEHIVNGTTQTTAGVYQVFVDLGNMVAADIVEIRVKEKVIGAGTQRTVFYGSASGVQPGPFVSPALMLMNGWDVTVKQTAGTARVFPYSIRSAA